MLGDNIAPFLVPKKKKPAVSDRNVWMRFTEIKLHSDCDFCLREFPGSLYSELCLWPWAAWWRQWFWLQGTERLLLHFRNRCPEAGSGVDASAPSVSMEWERLGQKVLPLVLFHLENLSVFLFFEYFGSPDSELCSPLRQTVGKTLENCSSLEECL